MHSITAPINYVRYLGALLVAVIFLVLPTSASAAENPTNLSAVKVGSVGMELNFTNPDLDIDCLTNSTTCLTYVQVTFLTGTPSKSRYYSEGSGSNPTTSTVSFSNETIYIEDSEFAGRTVKEVRLYYKNGTAKSLPQSIIISYSGIVDDAFANGNDYQLEITGSGLNQTSSIKVTTDEGPVYTYNLSNMMPGSSLTVNTANRIVITHPFLAGKTINTIEVTNISGGKTTLTGQAIQVDGIPPYPPLSYGWPIITDYMVTLGEEIGSALECWDAGWGYEPSSITYQWLRNNVVIAGQTSEYYAIQMADSDKDITCKAVATNSFGTTISAASPAYHVPKLIPLSSYSEPSMYHQTGVYTLGSKMICEADAESWQRPVTSLTYAWLRNNIVVPGATSSEYTLTQADAGKKLRCRVTANNEAGSAPALLSNEQTMVEVGTASSNNPPYISIVAAEVGYAAFCNAGSYNIYDETDYPLIIRWYYSSSPSGSKAEISNPPTEENGDGVVYVLQEADEGRYIHCSITIENSWGLGTPKMNTEPLGPIAATYPYYEEDSFSKMVLASNRSVELGDDRPAQVGEAIRCVFGGTLVNGGKSQIAKYEWYTRRAVPTGSPGHYVYQWIKIDGATGATYTPVQLNHGTKLYCRGGIANSKGTAWASHGETNSVGVRALFAPTLVSNPSVAHYNVQRYGAVSVGDEIYCNPGRYNFRAVNDGTSPFVHIEYYVEMLRNGVPMTPTIMGEPAEATMVDTSTMGWPDHYTIQASDIGATFTCKGQAQDGANGVTEHGLKSPIYTSAPLGPVAAPTVGGPVNTTAPTLTGTARMGEYLTCSNGVWSNGASFAYDYRWKVNGVVDNNENGQTMYELTLDHYGKTITCEVMATQDDEPYMSSSWVASNSRGPVTPTAPSQTDGQPSLNPGNGSVGDQFTCQVDNGVFDPPANIVPTTYAYTWYRDIGNGSQLISGATSQIYTAQPADTSESGGQIYCRVVATNSAGSSAPAESNLAWLEATDPEEEPQVPEDGFSSYSQHDQYGHLSVGMQLTCQSQGWTNNPTSFTYSWVRTSVTPPYGTTQIPGANSANYTVVESDRGHTIGCMSVAHNAAGASEPTPIGEGERYVPGVLDHESATVVFSGSSYDGYAAVGDNLTCILDDYSFVNDIYGWWMYEFPFTLTYRWLRATPQEFSGDYNGPATPISGATSASYTTTVSDFGNYLFCEVTAHNVYGSSQPTRGFSAIGVANEDGSPLW